MSAICFRDLISLHSILYSYYGGANGFMVLYDITKQKSFDNTESWIQEIQMHAPPEVVVMLVGNKCDEEDQRVVPTERGRAFAGT